MHKKFRIDWWLLAPVSVLVIIGLTVLSSLNPIFFRGQLLSLGISFTAFLFFSQIDRKILTAINIPIYITSVILLLIVLGIGIESHGAIRWIDIFGIRIQFSEILKPFLTVAFASHISKNKTPTIKSFLAIFLFLFPIILCIYLQPDLGNALIYTGAAFFTLIIIGYPLLWFVIITLPFVILSPIIWNIMHEYQRQRILTFLYPKKDPLGTSYNVIQSIIAVGSGMFFGKGLSEGTQSGLRFLPERHTDFIFATLSEGLGFIGSLIVLLAFGVLCLRIYVIFTNTNDVFEKTFSACCFAFFLTQSFLNIGMNIGFLPIVGVTLPFVSFGGSSLLSSFIFLGILSSISSTPKEKHVLEIR